MKKITILLLIFTASISFSQTQKWTQWKQTDCYKNIEYRFVFLDKNGEMNHFKLQFKNNYNSVISFNYATKPEIEVYNNTSFRINLSSLETSKEFDYFMKQESFYLLVNQLSLSPFPEKIEDCD